MPDRPTPFFARFGNAVSLMGQLLIHWTNGVQRKNGRSWVWLSNNSWFASRERARGQRDIQLMQFARLQARDQLSGLQEPVGFARADDAVRQGQELSDVVRTAEWSGAQRMGVGDGEFVDHFGA